MEDVINLIYNVKLLDDLNMKEMWSNFNFVVGAEYLFEFGLGFQIRLGYIVYGVLNVAKLNE